MKLTRQTSPRANRRRGSAMLVVLALLGIMTAMVTADFMAARGLDRELKLLEKRQTQRLGGRPTAGQFPATNHPAPRPD
jgi:type II secretory pathway pseudopilin PulG